MPWCCATARLDAPRVDVRILSAVTDSAGGTIVCETDAAPPVRFEWLRNNAPATLNLNAAGDTATDVPPGEYRVVVHDGHGMSYVRSIHMGRASLPTVVGYDVTHATGDTARNGTIVARIEPSTTTTRYLWTTGVVTDTPTLYDVCPGTYSVALLDVQFIHACECAAVYASRI